MKLLTVIVCMLALSLSWLALTWLVFQLQPDIKGSGQTPFRNYPNTKVTSTPSVRPAIDKTTLIIQQNVNCWLPWSPGETCSSERTYN